MIGAIAGDVIGSIYEWDNIKTVHFPLFQENCFVTDDSILTVALADSILTNTPYEHKLREYFNRYPDAGYGRHFRAWASSLFSGAYNSCGNGAGMRISPVGWAYNSLEEVLYEAEKNTAVTHNHPEGIKGGQAVAAAIFMGRTGSSKEEIRSYLENRFEYNLSRTCDEIRPNYIFDATAQGTIPEAIIAFMEATDFESAIRLAVSLGGDSDTLACITGSIAEAFYGGMPLNIRQKTLIYLDKHLSSVVERFVARFNIL